MKKVAHTIHHTHWDLIWYFTVQDADVQFSYNMKEILDAFDNNEISNFFLDGQTAPIDDYIKMSPREEERIKKYVASGQLVIGPFNSQLDSFITSGESVINNLRLGHKTANRLGKVSKIAYLPDSFGHSIDYPKIFNKYGIENFVITRGVGDEYKLGSEFYLKSNDNSNVLVHTMIAGYGYGTYSFKEGTLFSDKSVDYNKIDVMELIDRLLSYSTVDNAFVFPLGFDQNPMIHDVQKSIDYYNNLQNDIKFIETTWEKFFDTVKSKGKDIKIRNEELISTQYHRVHRSIYSARADIKALQDKCERILTYELQPIMSLLDTLGISYNNGLLDRTWETLILCQTHSSANLTDETNDYIERETKNALNLAYSHKNYLLKLMSLSIDVEPEEVPLIVFNTIPFERDEVIKTKVFTRENKFNLYHHHNKIPYTILNQEKKNNGVLRKNPLKIDSNKFYYETDILFYAKKMKGISYRTYLIKEEDDVLVEVGTKTSHFIENEYYKIFQTDKGIAIEDKKSGKLHEQALIIENTGDEGDSFDYSYPTEDWKIKDNLRNANVSFNDSTFGKKMIIKNSMKIPKNLIERSKQITSSVLEFNIEITLEKNSSVIKMNGVFKNSAEQHRVRLLFTGSMENQHSFVGTQYSVIKRQTIDPSHKNWKYNNYFEEPSPIYPLLNHVSAVHNNDVTTVYTRSSKEYEFVGKDCKDIGVTVFRSYGALGYPDLNRRPGRPSGMDYTIFETPKCQMKGNNYFELGLSYDTQFDENQIFNQYISYASDSSVYQKQSFEQSINPIDYFPTNPLSYKLPLEYSFLKIDNSSGVFGTLVKASHSDSYLCRMFNASNEKKELGEFISDATMLAFGETNLLEETNKDLKSEYEPGELKIIKIKKERK